MIQRSQPSSNLASIPGSRTASLLCDGVKNTERFRRDTRAYFKSIFPQWVDDEQDSKWRNHNLESTSPRSREQSAGGKGRQTTPLINGESGAVSQALPMAEDSLEVSAQRSEEQDACAACVQKESENHVKVDSDAGGSPELGIEEVECSENGSNGALKRTNTLGDGTDTHLAKSGMGTECMPRACQLFSCRGRHQQSYGFESGKANWSPRFLSCGRGHVKICTSTET